MAYIINKFNSAQLTVVEDGTVDQTTDIKLVGKNYAGYGEIQNENFIFLLENFAGGNEPPKAIAGQIWFDSTNSKLKFYDGTKWRTTGGAEINNSAPAGLAEGDFWWDNNNEQLYAYNGTSFVLVGPQGVGDSVTRFQSRTILDTNGTPKAVIVSIVEDEIIHIISSNEFTIGGQDSPDYPGFDVVRQGITLKNTVNANNGVTSTGHRFHGTASNAEKLGGVAADQFIKSGEANFSDSVEFADTGFTIGASNDIVIRVVNDDKALISNQQGTEMYFQVNNVLSQQKMPLRLNANVVLPGYADVNNLTGVNTVDIGSESASFGNVYATDFKGRATSAGSLELNGIAVTATTGNVASTIVARDASRNIEANYFIGTATQAQYADLAEKYLPDQMYDPGYVLVFGGEKEVTTTTINCDYKLAGVVSTDPAYLMNSALMGVAIALKGRVPCNVVGPVHKGDILVTSTTAGAATVWPVTSSAQLPHAMCIVGTALETNEDEGVKKVEIFVQ